MENTRKSRVAPAAWIVGAFLIGWPLFLFFDPRTKTEDARPSRPVSSPSKLRAVGLADNVDWEDMPGFFAVWADKLDWKNDKTQFAYWNPGSNSYSYFFEAIRTEGKVRFRVLSKNEVARYVDAEDGSHVPMEVSISPDGITHWETLKESPTHPFAFFPHYDGIKSINGSIPNPSRLKLSPTVPAVSVDRDDSAPMKPPPLKKPENEIYGPGK